LAIGRKVVFQPGETVFEEGEQGENMYIVLSGSFEVIKRGRYRQPKCLAVVESGEHFGEMAVIDNLERTATVRALTPAVTLKFNQRDLLQQPAASIKLFQNMARLLSKRLRKTNEVLILKNS
jgi:ATP-binding cassette subfamily B protein